MRAHSLLGPSEALYRVFVQPSIARTPARLVSALSDAPNQPLRRIRKPHPQRPLPLTNRHAFSTTATCHAKTRAPEKRSQLWDEEITARRVQLVDPETNKPGPPQGTRFVLRSFDRKTHRLVCISPLPTPKSKEAEEEWIPICKLMDKKEQYLKDKAKADQKKAAKKSSADTLKTLELNWAIDLNDLGHRMKRMKEFLEEGRKVDIVLARKKGGRVASVEDCNALLQKIREQAESVQGAKELKALEGKLGGFATLSYEGPKPSN